MIEGEDLTIELLEKREERLQGYAQSWFADQEYCEYLHEHDAEVLPKLKYAQ